MASRKKYSARLGAAHAKETGFESASAPEPLAAEAQAAFEPAPDLELASNVEIASEPAPFYEAAVSQTAAVGEDASEPGPVLESDPVSEPAADMAVAAVMDPAPFAHVAENVEAPRQLMTEAHGNANSMVETGPSQTHAKFSQLRSSADEAADAHQTSHAATKTGAAQLNVQALEALTVVVEANFDFFKSALAVKSPFDYLRLQSEFARKQIEFMTAHTKIFGEFAQKVVVDAVEPIQAGFVKTFPIR